MEYGWYFLGEDNINLFKFRGLRSGVAILKIILKPVMVSDIYSGKYHKMHLEKKRINNETLHKHKLANILYFYIVYKPLKSVQFL